MYSCRHSHLTFPQWHEDVMCSSQALIWQGFSASESKAVTAVWGGIQCKGGIIQLQRQGSALSLPSSSFSIYQGVHNVPRALQAAGITMPQKREADESQPMPEMKQTPRLHPRYMQYLEKSYLCLNLENVHAGGKLPSLHNRTSEGEAAKMRF